MKSTSKGNGHALTNPWNFLNENSIDLPFATSSSPPDTVRTAPSTILRVLKHVVKPRTRAYSRVDMPEWYPVKEEAADTIQPCKNFIVRLPSQNYKVIDLRPNTTISLGKFGAFFADQLIGKPFGPSWEILQNKEIKLLEREEQDEEDDGVVRDNRNVFDDKTAQLLSAEEIEKHRQVMSSKDIISTITSNNVNFDKKSVFSQEKYVRSKEQRFLRAFTPIQPSVGNVCDFLWVDKNRDRCMDLSLETIGLMLSLANVCAGGRYLVIDETGLLVAAILERGGSVFLLHDKQEPNLDILKFFPHLQKFFRLHPSKSDSDGDTSPISDQTFYSMDILAAFYPSNITLTPPAQESHLYERKLRTYQRELQIHKVWNEGGFDGFISVSSFEATSYLPRCLERLELCSNVIVYSPFREPIVELQNYYTTKTPTRPLLSPAVHEVRAPKWNTLKGRVRPDMIGRGGGGWVFSGTKVEEAEPEVSIWREGKKRRMIEVTNGSEMEDVQTDTPVDTE